MINKRNIKENKQKENTDSKLKIGIDIDNVISDSYPKYIKQFDQTFGIKVAFDELVDFYYFLNHDEIDKDKAKALTDKLLKDDQFQMSFSPIGWAQEVIENWSDQGHSIHYITARPKYIKNATYAWLKKHGFLVPKATVDLQEIFFQQKQGTIDAKYKRDIIKKRKINLLIEDTKEIAEIVDIPVFLFSRPWNQGKLSKNVTRVSNWKEIEKLLIDKAYRFL